MESHAKSSDPHCNSGASPSSHLADHLESHQREAPSRLAGFFPEGAGLVSRFTDRDISEITTLLQESKQQAWSKSPRLYIVLRKIGHLPLLDGLLDQGINDFWFPFDSKSVQHLQKSAQNEFLEAQESIMTTGLNLEKGADEKHYHFKGRDTIPFDIEETLGTGAISKVEKVVSHFSRREYARKTFRRQKGPSKIEIQSFMNELRILKRIRHQHCVELIASYTDARNFGIIMLPVAECNLRGFCSREVILKPILRTFFGCLSSAMSYLHSIKIRHRDIKPENILVKGKHVYLADFGISLDWENLTRGTTVADSGKTLAYCAPEVANHQKRNSSSDIWSLGCVFLEICTVLKDRNLDQMRQFFKERTDTWAYYKNGPSIKEWMGTLKACGHESDNDPLEWVESMLQIDSTKRPPASELHQYSSGIRSGSGTGASPFCASCCVLEEEVSSEAGAESDDELWADEQATSPQLTDNIVNIQRLSTQVAAPEHSLATKSPAENQEKAVDEQSGQIAATKNFAKPGSLEKSSDQPRPVTTVDQVSAGEHLAATVEPKVFPKSLPKLSAQDWESPARMMLVISGDTQFMNSLLECRPDLHEDLLHSRTASLIELIECLIREGLDVNDGKYRDAELGGPASRVLSWSDERDFQSLFRLLIRKIDFGGEGGKKAKIFTFTGKSGLIWAIDDLVELDLSKPIEWKESLTHSATSQGNLVTLKHIQSSNVFTTTDRGPNGFTILHGAVLYGYKDIVEWALEGGKTFLETLWHGLTPLHFACKGGNEEIVRLLINHGANTSARVELEGDDTAPVLSTPMAMACLFNHASVLKVLLESHKDFLVRRDMDQLLLTICRKNQVEVAKVLLSEGADVNTNMIIKRMTCLHIAAEEGFGDLARLLLANGADLNARCGSTYSFFARKTPMDLAKKGGHQDIIRMLTMAKLDRLLESEG